MGLLLSTDLRAVASASHSRGQNALQVSLNQYTLCWHLALYLVFVKSHRQALASTYTHTHTHPDTHSFSCSCSIPMQANTLALLYCSFDIQQMHIPAPCLAYLRLSFSISQHLTVAHQRLAMFYCYQKYPCVTFVVHFNKYAKWTLLKSWSSPVSICLWEGSTVSKADTGDLYSQQPFIDFIAERVMNGEKVYECLLLFWLNPPRTIYHFYSNITDFCSLGC